MAQAETAETRETKKEEVEARGVIIGIRTAGDFALIKILSLSGAKWKPSEWHFKGSPDLLSFIRMGDFVYAAGYKGNLPASRREVMMATTFQKDQP